MIGVERGRVRDRFPEIAKTLGNLAVPPLVNDETAFLPLLAKLLRLKLRLQLGDFSAQSPHVLGETLSQGRGGVSHALGCFGLKLPSLRPRLQQNSDHPGHARSTQRQTRPGDVLGGAHDVFFFLACLNPSAINAVRHTDAVQMATMNRMKFAPLEPTT